MLTTFALYHEKVIIIDAQSEGRATLGSDLSAVPGGRGLPPFGRPALPVVRNALNPPGLLGSFQMTLPILNSEVPKKPTGEGRLRSTYWLPGRDSNLPLLEASRHRERSVSSEVTVPGVGPLHGFLRSIAKQFAPGP